MLNALLVHPQPDHLKQHQDGVEGQTDAESSGDATAVIVTAFCRNKAREVLTEVDWPWWEAGACAEEGELRAG